MKGGAALCPSRRTQRRVRAKQTRSTLRISRQRRLRLLPPLLRRPRLRPPVLPTRKLQTPHQLRPLLRLLLRRRPPQWCRSLPADRILPPFNRLGTAPASQASLGTSRTRIPTHRRITPRPFPSNRLLRSQPQKTDRQPGTPALNRQLTNKPTANRHPRRLIHRQRSHPSRRGPRAGTCLRRNPSARHLWSRKHPAAAPCWPSRSLNNQDSGQANSLTSLHPRTGACPWARPADRTLPTRAGVPWPTPRTGRRTPRAATPPLQQPQQLKQQRTHRRRPIRSRRNPAPPHQAQQKPRQRKMVRSMRPRPARRWGRPAPTRPLPPSLHRCPSQFRAPSQRRRPRRRMPSSGRRPRTWQAAARNPSRPS